MAGFEPTLNAGTNLKTLKLLVIGSVAPFHVKRGNPTSAKGVD